MTFVPYRTRERGARSVRDYTARAIERPRCSLAQDFRQMLSCASVPAKHPDGRASDARDLAHPFQVDPFPECTAHALFSWM